MLLFFSEIFLKFKNSLRKNPLINQIGQIKIIFFFSLIKNCQAKQPQIQIMKPIIALHINLSQIYSEILIT